MQHRAIEKLEQVLNLSETCGYITFVNTGVPDIGCEQYDINVHLKKPKARVTKEKKREAQPPTHVPTPEEILVNGLLHRSPITNAKFNLFVLKQARPKTIPDLCSPMDGSEITSFNIAKKTLNTVSSLKSPDENHFAITPENRSPSNVFRSEDCNELLAKELAKLDETMMEDDQSPGGRLNLVSQSSIEIEFSNEKENNSVSQTDIEPEFLGEVSSLEFEGSSFQNNNCFFFGRNGLFWTSTLAFRCLMSIATHAYVNIL